LIICIVGPTCSGKSTLADKVANYLNGIVVNFDAFQIYKEMKIGTAKPTDEELASGNYFLYNIKHLDENYDVAQYQKDCREFIKNNSDKNIVLVGGTGLYLKATLFDYHFEKEDPMPSDFRVNDSNETLYNELLNIDSDDANKIGVNNRKRLLRALFVYQTHNASKTALNKNGKNRLLYENVEFIGLDINREQLYEKINLRVDKMFEDGLEDEIKDIFSKYDKNLRSLQAIGYKEFAMGLNIVETKELIKKNTRNYAKRQMTFFKHQFNNVEWFSNIEEACDYVRNKY